MTEAEPFVFDDGAEAKRFAPATQRNRDVLVSVLRDILPDTGTVLEIASGTGEHIVHFAAYFPHLSWQPTDFDPAGLASIEAWVAESRLPNIAPAVQLDAAQPIWPIDQVQAIVCINMVHIAPWAAAIGLFAGASKLLSPGARLFLYGPFLEADMPTAPSNEAFDASLRGANPEWGLRSIEDMVKLASDAGFILENRITMPANNLSLVFQLRD